MTCGTRRNKCGPLVVFGSSPQRCRTLQLMSRICACCRAEAEPVLPDTGGTPEPSTAGAEEACVWGALTCCGFARARGVKLLLRPVGPCELGPAQAQALAVAAAGDYPSGVVALHLEKRRCVLFTARAPPQCVHLLCAVDLLRLRLSVGLVVGRQGKAYALQVGRRKAPLLGLVSRGIAGA